MSKKIVLSLVFLSLFLAMPLQAAEFPTKEVQIIIPWAAGGATDLIFRALAGTTGKYLGKAWSLSIDRGEEVLWDIPKPHRPDRMAIRWFLRSPTHYSSASGDHCLHLQELRCHHQCSERSIHVLGTV